MQPLLDAVTLLSAQPGRQAAGRRHRSQKAATQGSRASPIADEPFCGLVFKIHADKHGDLHYVRVYSGELKANSRVLQPGQGQEGKRHPAVAHPGRSPRTGAERSRPATSSASSACGIRSPATRCATPQQPILLESIQFPETVISMAIEPETSTERKKLADVLEMMKRQDPTFRAHENEETGQTLISGMGELHLEVIKHRLLRDFNLNVRVHKPRVSYQETVAKAAEALGKCQRQVGGQVLFAEAKIRVTPRDNNKPCEVSTNWFTEESAVRNAVTILVAALKEHAEGGGLLGCPLWNCAIEVLEHPFPEPMPSEVALRIAAADAFTKVLEAAGVVLMEPIMELEVTTPEDHLGDVINDLQQRRAIITSTQNRGATTVIDAEVPLATMFGYSAGVRSLSQGRATFSMEPLKYGPAPTDVQDNFM